MKFILKQNGDAPKSINYKGKFESNEDMIYHLEELQKSWNESEYGAFDCDLMEVVEGMEVAISGFYNGHDWLRDKSGKAQFFLNFEHKKECDGDLGETTGEMGTLFFGTDEEHKLAEMIMLPKEIDDVLRETNYRGVFDINGCLTKKGYVAFEPTSRFGIPATSYEFVEGLKTNTGELLATMAKGEDTMIEIVKGWGLCQVVASKPFPVDSDVNDKDTSIGEKLWIMGKNEHSVADFSPDHLKHIHLENFERTKDGDYKVATKNGYLLVVTGVDKSIAKVREKLLKYIKENIFITGQKYRHDLGSKIEEYESQIEENKL
jgi:phosphoribosylamine-glycine ligase